MAVAVAGVVDSNKLPRRPLLQGNSHIRSSDRGGGVRRVVRDEVVVQVSSNSKVGVRVAVVVVGLESGQVGIMISRGLWALLR